MKTKARVLAYYLPQYHPIPENDEWWGKGFTEWTNVGKAKKLFPGHCQPRVPTELGYYDLRLPEVREAQANMARVYGVEGFVYWHYWFGNGRRLLERPFNEVLKSGKPDFPFALAWANETWKGFVFGHNDERNALIEQNYFGEYDYKMHFYHVLPAFRDRRYITCDGKPIFIVYKADNMPDMALFIDLWKNLAIENGLKGIYFIAHELERQGKGMASYFYKKRKSEGFDGVNFVNMMVRDNNQLPIWLRLLRKFFYNNPRFRFIPSIRPYRTDIFETPLDGQEDVFPSVLPDWDHTPRTGIRGDVLYGSTPKKFGDAVKCAVDRIKNKPEDKRLLFVKSWNEWAEGNYLEPDLRWGHSYLEALKEAISYE